MRSQLLVSRHLSGFDEKDVPSRRCPGKARDHARTVYHDRGFGKELRSSQIVVQLFRLDRDRRWFSFRYCLCHFSADVRDLTLQVPDAGLARIVLDDPPERILRDHDLVGPERIRLDLLGDQVFLRDIQFLRAPYIQAA